jgi:putative membrane protein
MATDRIQAALGIFLRGMLMGAADIVPGVSGGTMAFITGIYDRLLGAIAAVDMQFLRLLLRARIGMAWHHVDGAFLALLLAGILVSVFTLARVITLLLETQPLLLWSFFFGLILGSALLLLRRVTRWSVPQFIGLLSGTLFAAVVGLLPTLTTQAALTDYFLAGFVAICAMILPGISGSFILVLIGMYPAVLAAVHQLQLLPLAVFAAGAAAGLLTFSRLLHRLLRDFHAATLATLTGFLLGSLLVVWPWKLPRSADPDALSAPVSPSLYAVQAGDAQLLACLLLGACGLAAVWLLENRWGGPER